jgi:hypothetical protein
MHHQMFKEKIPAFDKRIPKDTLERRCLVT